MKRLVLGGLSVLLISAAIAPTLKAETFKEMNSNSLDNTLVSQSAQSTIKSGTFVSGEHPTSGNARIVVENGKRYLEFDETFRTDNGPDLFVVLHRSNDVIGSTTAPAHSLAEGDYLLIAPLKQVSNSQRYVIPDNVNLSDYQSVAIWCRQFNATFGAAALDS